MRGKMGKARASSLPSTNLSNCFAMLPADAKAHPTYMPMTGVPLSYVVPDPSPAGAIPTAMTALVAHTPTATTGPSGIIQWGNNSPAAPGLMDPANAYHYRYH